MGSRLLAPALFALCLARPVTAQEATMCPPNTEYTIKDVTLECARQGIAGGYRTHLQGDGSAVRERWSGEGKTVERFSVALETLFELLKLAYERRFFDLQPSYLRPPLISMTPDGRVAVFTSRNSGRSSRSVTVRILDCTKTVTWTLGPDNPPPTDAAFISDAIDSVTTILLKTSSNPDSLDQLLAPWDYPAMLGAIPLDSESTWTHFGVPWPVALDSVRLLASYAIQLADTSVNNALLWYRIHDAKGEPVWVLEQAYKMGTREWHPSYQEDSPWLPIRPYRKRPTNSDVYAFILDPPSSWKFEPTGSTEFSSGHVRERTWKAVIGEAPTKRYYRNKK